MPSEAVVYRRAQLYEEVWSEAVDTVAKRYGVSGVALAKTCRKLRVPLPGRGYWARKRAGQRLKRPPLPPVRKGEPEEIASSRWVEPEQPKPILSPETEALIVRERAPEVAIQVPTTLEQPHKFVTMSAKILQKAKPIDGVVHCRDRRCLDITVSPGALDRALRLMDAILKALEARDLRVEITDVRTDEPRPVYYERRDNEVPSNATRVNVAEEWIRFALTERVSRKKLPPPPAPKHLRGLEADMWQRLRRPPVEYVPTGELALTITTSEYFSATTSWRDGKRRQLEAFLNEFVSSLYVFADAMKARRAEQARARKEMEEAEKRRSEEQRQREEYAKLAKELEETIGQWRLARDIRAYVSEARGMVADAEQTLNAGCPFDEWLQFASAHAERVDPLADLRAEIAKVAAERAAKGVKVRSDADANSEAPTP